MRFSQLQDPTMGIGGIPGTFPTGKVLSYLEDWGTYDFTRTLVNDIQSWYKEAVQNMGYPAYMPGTGNKLKLFQYLSAKTGLEVAQLQEYLEALKAQVTAGEVDNKWLIQTKPKSSALIPGMTDIGDTVKKAANTAKWIGIVGASLGALYFLSPILKGGLLLLKRKKK